MTDIFNEVDEDLRREKLEKLWKKTAPFIIGAVVIFIGGMAGRVYWQDSQEADRIAESDKYQAAIAALKDGRDTEAQGALSNLSGEADFGYELLSQLQRAGSLARQGDADGALGIYAEVTDNSNYEDRYRGFAGLMAGMLLIDQGRYDEARVRLEPLSGEGGFWSFSAKELLGLMAMEAGNYEEAQKTFLEISIDLNAPQEMKVRAGEFLQIIDVKKPAPEIAAETLAEDEEPVAQEDSNS